MPYMSLDDDELLGLSLDAMGNAKGMDALLMLKALVERNRGHVHAQYLLAAQHAQLGLLDKAESGFRAAIALSPGLVMARIQLGQLLLVKGEPDQAVEVLSQVQSDADPTLSAYARAFLALAQGQLQEAVERLEEGLARNQANPALTEDMQRLLAQLRVQVQDGREAVEAGDVAPAVSSLFLTNYGRHG